MCPGLSAYPLFILSMFPRAVLSSEAYDDFLSYRFSWPTKAPFASLVQCSVRIAHPAVRNRTSAGNVWHTQRDLSVLSLSSGRLIGKLHFLPPNIPTPPERVPRGRAQQSMQTEPKMHGLSYPKRIGQRFVFWVSQPVAAAARTRPFSLLSTRTDRTASISAATGFTPRWTYIILYCSGLCGKDAPGGLAAGGGPPAVSIVWGPRRPRARHVDCVGTPLPLHCSRKLTSRRGPLPS